MKIQPFPQQLKLLLISKQVYMNYKGYETYKRKENQGQRESKGGKVFALQAAHTPS